MRIILLVLLLYVLLYSLYALIQSIRKKKVQKLAFFKKATSDNLPAVIDQENAPEKYRHHLVFHLAVVLGLSILIILLALV